MWPRGWTTLTGSPTKGASISGSSLPALTSFTIVAPSSTAARATDAFVVSIEIGAAVERASGPTTGAILLSSSSASTGDAPGRVDSPLVHFASRASYDTLLEAGVRIERFHRGLLHSKTLTIDRHIGLIGSANVDMRSFALNFEVSLFVYDSDFASQLRFLQKHYIQQSTPVSPRDWARRPVIRRFGDNVARLAGPLL